MDSFLDRITSRKFLLALAAFLSALANHQPLAAAAVAAIYVLAEAHVDGRSTDT